MTHRQNYTPEANIGPIGIFMGTAFVSVMACLIIMVINELCR